MCVYVAVGGWVLSHSHLCISAQRAQVIILGSPTLGYQLHLNISVNGTINLEFLCKL